ncbi:TPA: SP_0009 family protein [Streptococcus pneumoniae]
MENLLDVIEQFLSLSDEKLEELADKNQLLRLTRRKGKEECVNS